MLKRNGFIGTAVVFLSTILLFQNCSKKSSGFTYDASLDRINGKYGYGAGGGGYNCVPGKRLGIWLDPDDSGTFRDEYKLGIIVSYQGSKSAANNYNYYSASAHPLVGPKPIGFNTNVFFYDGPEGLGLTMFSNIDEGGSSDNEVHYDIQTYANAANDSVLISDDSGELKYISTNSSGAKLYQGRFHYWNNTDGGVIGPFKGDQFKIRVKILSTGDVQDARFYSANGYSFNLKDSQNQISSFLIAYENYEDCSETP